ncbi:MAG: patatin-like phospholipase family protein, partial [Prevotella fusca]
AARTTNFFNLAMTTISLMMDRVKKMQRADNLYETYVGKEHFAYVPLEWECGERLIHGFVKNLKEGNIHPDVWQAHAITEEEVSRLKGADEQSATKAIIEKVKKAIKWSELEKKIPRQETENIARSVGTSLTALSLQEIESLAAHSAWLTEMQVRLYLPMLIAERE